MSVRKRAIKERLARIRKQESESINAKAFFDQIQQAIDKWQDRPFELDGFLFDAFGPPKSDKPVWKDVPLDVEAKVQT